MTSDMILLDAFVCEISQFGIIKVKQGMIFLCQMKKIFSLFQVDIVLWVKSYVYCTLN